MLFFVAVSTNRWQSCKALACLLVHMGNIFISHAFFTFANCLRLSAPRRTNCNCNCHRTRTPNPCHLATWPPCFLPLHPIPPKKAKRVHLKMRLARKMVCFLALILVVAAVTNWFFSQTNSSFEPAAGAFIKKYLRTF